VNILVLGGHGFIGSHIVESLCKQGHDLRVFARKPSEYSLDGEWFNGDFLDKSKLSEALDGMDAVVHSISSTVPATSAENPIYDIKSNLIGTVELLRLMKVYGVSRLVYFSSGGTVYGNPTTTPVSEKFPLNAISSHGAVKVAIEKFIEVSKNSCDIQPVILRPSNPYGERQGHFGVQGLISTVLNNAMHHKPVVIYGDGTVVRDYIYVKDVANLVCKVLDTDRCGIYNVGSGKGYDINQIIDIIESVTGLKIVREYREKRDFDVKKIILDSSLAREHFDWKAKVSLEDGIKKQYLSLKNI
jgi:UDP-glucose 4-epimerase